jgi:hypothetical protein
MGRKLGRPARTRQGRKGLVIFGMSNSVVCSSERDPSFLSNFSVLVALIPESYNISMKSLRKLFFVALGHDQGGGWVLG